MTRRYLQYIIMTAAVSCQLQAGSVDDASKLVMHHLKQHWKDAPRGEAKKSAGAALDAFARIKKEVRKVQSLEHRNQELVSENASLAQQMVALKKEKEVTAIVPPQKTNKNFEAGRLRSRIRDLEQRESVFSQRIQELSQEVTQLRARQ